MTGAADQVDLARLQTKYDAVLARLEMQNDRLTFVEGSLEQLWAEHRNKTTATGGENDG